MTVSASASILSADAEPEDPHANRHRKKTRATREHLVRKADGGSDHDSNIVMACAGCNHERGDAPVEVWKSFVMSRATNGAGEFQCQTT